MVTSPEGGGGHLDRYTVTDMCGDLAYCMDTLEQDLLIILRNTTTYTCIVNYHYCTDYAWYSVHI